MSEAIIRGGELLRVLVYMYRPLVVYRHSATNRFEWGNLCINSKKIQI